ncbi:hypothetical protein SB717_23385 [Priestia sp. SIMBA_032]
MNKDIEEIVVKSFFAKRIQERVMFGLCRRFWCKNFKIIAMNL